MRLSFRKIVLIFSTVALGSMLGASAQNSTHESVLVEGYTFEREWKSEVFPTPWENNRQGFGQDNKFYIHDKASNISFPSQNVLTTFPVNVFPLNGEFFPLERNFSGLTVHF